MNSGKTLYILFVVMFCLPLIGFGQHPDSDTFFLSKKKGIIGRLAKTISTTDPYEKPQKLINPFLKYKNHKINSVEIIGLDFNQSINDTVIKKENLLTKLGNRIHKNTKESVIRNNLFFKEGQVIFPYLMADNEKYLRDQDFIQDARILLLPTDQEDSSVDIIVIVRDVFSIGGKINISSLNDFKLEVRDENLMGTGSRLSGSALYDKSRNPTYGYGGEFLQRNIKGKFINWQVGFTNFYPAYNSDRDESVNIHTKLEKPLYSRYTRWTGALELEMDRSYNRYIADSLFYSDFRYNKINSDFWAGYNIGSGREKLTDHTNRLRHFVALRVLYNHFFKIPEKFTSEYNYNYADINGTLLSYSLYKQNFYRTNFIYGFGRAEDVPEGITTSAIGGWTIKNGKKRAYYALTGEGSFFTGKKYFGFTLRAGSFTYKNNPEDIDIMLGIDHFSELRKISNKWRNRNFMNVVLTKQYNPILNTPLFLNSEFGLPYFSENAEGSFRATAKVESVFFNLNSYLGFKFAPFVFTDFSLLAPAHTYLTSANGYTALGGGLRTRNESLIFGTIEVKAYYFPRTIGEMKSWKFDISTNIKFKYNSTFIKRPDFVVTN